MHNQTVRLVPRQRNNLETRQPLGHYLVEADAIHDTDLLRALVIQRHQNAPLGRILINQGWANQDQVLDALSHQHGLQKADLSNYKLNPRLLRRRPAQFWLKHRAIPLLQIGPQLVVAIAHPDQFATLQNELHASFEQVTPVLATEEQITTQLQSHFHRDLAQRANIQVPLNCSSRDMHGASHAQLPLLCCTIIAGLSVYAPVASFTVFCLLALLSLSLFTGLKLSGFLTHFANDGKIERRQRAEPRQKTIKRLPRISMLVPLFREANVCSDLLRRLQQLSYPRALLEVVLVLEQHDDITRAALDNVILPDWMQVIEVPQLGTLKTKPRAMNYALNFCSGDIIGVWDAEDAPARSQLEHVARTFEKLDDDVVCLQGVLDYYNPHINWLSRCFTLEYASWFRIVLPGLARLGLVVPLGGTTLFIKRDILEQLGGWDAHNVTEDADLGVRLCRDGYRTEMISTATHEEANCQVWPWVRQRSRWLKGFMVTYLVHMRHPRLLWKQLGWKRYLGFQAFFLGTVGQFLLAPFLWSFWFILLGVSHPSATILPMYMLYGAAALLMLFELIGISISIAAAFASNRRHLAIWAPTMIFYFPLAAIAAYKALHELIWHPFFWDKTTHGVTARSSKPPNTSTGNLAQFHPR